MARRATDRRVAKVLAAFDAICSSPTRDEAMVDLFMCEVVDSNPDRFSAPARWPDVAVREVLLSYLLLAPDVDLADMVMRAAGQMRWLRGWEREHRKAS